MHLRRLLIFWVVAGATTLLCFAAPPVGNAVSKARYDFAERHALGLSSMHLHRGSLNFGPGGAGGTAIDKIYPLPWQIEFWRQLHKASPQAYYGPFTNYGGVSPIRWIDIFLAWPWVTLISLVIFRFSMRQAKIRASHLLRAVIYSSNFGLLFSILLTAVYCVNPEYTEGWILLGGALGCAAITSYRLSIAFGKYLRVHLPVATVLASQIIALLAVFIVLTQIASFFQRR